LFREPKPRTRSVTRDVAGRLINAVAEDRSKQLLLVWLFRQGTRISETLRVSWEDIDLSGRTVQVYVSKTKSWKHFPIDDELLEHLAAVPEAERQGRVWRWTERSSVYSWLRPLVARLGVKFTPHMARHSVGTWLNEEGAGQTTIMEKLGHADVRSSARYQSASIDVVRAASARIGRLGAPLGKRAA
jgi:integrase